MKILLLGPPKSGKDEIGTYISKKYNIPHLSANHLLTAVTKEDSELGKLVQDAVDACRVSEELLIAVLKIRLNKIDLKKGFVLSAYPCNSNKADVLDVMLGELGVKLDQIIILNVDNDKLLEDMIGQSSCIKCGEVYNIYSNPPIVDHVCDVCGGRVKSPPQSYEESVANRLRNYDLGIAPVLKHYATSGVLSQIDVSHLEQSQIFKALEEILIKVVVSPLLTVKPKKTVTKKKVSKKKITKKKITKKKVSKKKVSKKKKVTKKKIQK